jgi:hypothetical protein
VEAALGWQMRHYHILRHKCISPMITPPSGAAQPVHLLPGQLPLSPSTTTYQVITTLLPISPSLHPTSRSDHSPIMSTAADMCPVYAPFFGAMGCASAIIFTCIGAA